MWKILVGFVVFAALAMYILTKSGGDVDLGGEKHEVAPASHAPAAAPTASQTAAPTAAATAAPTAASEPAPAASK